MARNRARASMREGPLAELFRATEAAQRQAERERGEKEAHRSEAPTVEHVGPDEMTIAEASALPAERNPSQSDAWPEREPAPAPAPPAAASAAPAARPSCGAPGRGLPRGALRRPAPRLNEHAAARVRRLPRGHPRRRRRGRWSQRRQQDDRGRDLPGRVRRGQHRHPAAARLRGADQAPHRPRAHPGPRLRAPTPRSGARPPRTRTTRSSTSCAAPTWSSSPPARAAAPARAPRPSSRASPASSARSPSGIVTMPFKFEGTRRREQAREGRGRRCAPTATRSSSSPTTGCSRCSTSRPRCSRRSASPTTCSARASRGSAT